VNPDGRIVVALVLPYRPFDEFSEYPVDRHTRWTTTRLVSPIARPAAGSAVPERRLPIAGETFEQQACSAVRDVFEPAGFNVLCWTKLPYLCEGDLSQDYYWLHDAVFVLSVRTQDAENS